jgi:signal transduction histidine kinase
MSDLLNRREEVQKALMDMIASLTNIPIGLYESHDGQIEGIIPDASRDNFEAHCKTIQSYPGGKERCEADQCNRASKALRSADEHLSLCYAGMYNQHVPVKIGSQTRAVMVYGEMQVEGDEYLNRALEHHEQAVAELGLSDKEATLLRQHLLNAKKYTPEQLEKVKNLVVKAEQWLYALLDQEERAKKIVERTTHEIQTRLQAVMSSAENLLLEIDSLNRKEITAYARDVFNSALAFDTVVQTLGEHLEEYNFRRQNIPSIIRETKRVYDSEATRRGIDIQLQLQKEEDISSSAVVSRRHLQLAINNLVHNAIKYSFSGNNIKRRFITIAGQPDNNYYRITVYNYGVGIQPDEYEAIFRENYQGRLTQGEYRTGSGKGLYFVKRIIDRHHGRIAAESRLMAEESETAVGKPHLTKFTLYLPYKQPKDGVSHG